MISCLTCRKKSVDEEDFTNRPLQRVSQQPDWKPSTSFECLPPGRTPSKRYFKNSKSTISLSQTNLASVEERQQQYSSKKLTSFGHMFWRGVKRTASSNRVDSRRSLLEGTAHLIQRKFSKKGLQLSQSQEILSTSCLAKSDPFKSLENGGSETNLSGSRTVHLLHLTVGEAKNVPAKRKYFCELFLDDAFEGRTSSKLENSGVFWGESFSFETSPLDSVVVRLYKECSRSGEKSLVGDITILPDEIEGKKSVEKWYTMGQRGKTEENPSVRVKSHLVRLTVLPAYCYSELLAFITTAPAQLCAYLEPYLNAKAKEELATCMVRIMYSEGRDVDFLCDLIVAEISKLNDPRLMFRGNSLGSKAMEAYMKILGQNYLQGILGDFLQSLIRAGDDCEVDPTKLSNLQNLEKNQKTLTLYTEVIWCKILQSASDFPRELRHVFNAMRQRLILGDRGDLVENLVSSCVFLRFLCPAILTPSLFSLVSEFPSENANRTLTLVAKSIQTLANFARFGGKEGYMEFMNGFVEKQWTNMKQFLHVISTLPSENLGENRVSVDICKEQALLTRYLIEAIRLLGPNELTSLRQILGCIQAVESDPQTAWPQPGRSLPCLDRPLSDYDNVTGGDQSDSSIAPPDFGRLPPPDVVQIESSDPRSPTSTPRRKTSPVARSQSVFMVCDSAPVRNNQSPKRASQQRPISLHVTEIPLATSEDTPTSRVSADAETILSPTHAQRAAEWKYLSEIQVLRRQMEETQRRLQETESREYQWRQKYAEIEPKLCDVKDVLERIKALEAEVREAHQKDDVIQKQKQRISSLETMNASLLTFSLQLKNHVMSNSQSSPPLVSSASPPCSKPRPPPAYNGHSTAARSISSETERDSLGCSENSEDFDQSHDCTSDFDK